MATNQYLPVAVAPGSNVTDPVTWSGAPERINGFAAGTAPSNKFNIAWRQSSVITSAIAQTICDLTGQDMLDDGNVAAAETKFRSMLSAVLVTQVPPLYIGQDGSSNPNTIVATVAPAFQTLTAGGVYVIRINNTITGPSQMTLNQGQTYPIVVGQGAATSGLDAFAGDWVAFTFTGAAYQILNDKRISNSISYSPTTVQQLQQIIVALSMQNVASNARVAINLPAGQINLTSITGPLAFAHACGLQIDLVGKPLLAAIPTAAQLRAANGGPMTNAGVLAVYQGIFATQINTVGVNALEVRGFLGSVQNILFVGDGTASGGHYGALVGNWSTAQPATAAIKFINCAFHNFGLDNVRAEQGGFIQANNCLSTYATSHGFHISHESSLECNVGSILSMYNVQGVALQNQGLFAVDSASGTVDISNNSVAGIAGLGDATVNLNPATGVRIQNNAQVGIGAGFLCNVALSQNGSTQFSGNGIDISINGVSNILTFGCSLPSGSSPSRGSTGNNGATVY